MAKARNDTQESIKRTLMLNLEGHIMILQSAASLSNQTPQTSREHVNQYGGWLSNLNLGIIAYLRNHYSTASSIYENPTYQAIAELDNRNMNCILDDLRIEITNKLSTIEYLFDGK